jgi:hypothetical protein
VQTCRSGGKAAKDDHSQRLGRSCCLHVGHTCGSTGSKFSMRQLIAEMPRQLSLPRHPLPSPLPFPLLDPLPPLSTDASVGAECYSCTPVTNESVVLMKLVQAVLLHPSSSQLALRSIQFQPSASFSCLSIPRAPFFSAGVVLISPAMCGPWPLNNIMLAITFPGGRLATIRLA